VIWGGTAVVSAVLFVLGERGVRRWQASFNSHASPEERLEREQLRGLNRFQMEYVAAAIAAFVLVLFIPVSPGARFLLFVGFLLVLAVAFGAMRHRRR
jgi:hypothetical protein